MVDPHIPRIGKAEPLVSIIFKFLLSLSINKCLNGGYQISLIIKTLAL